ncbi:MAG: hypothetical protein H0T46_19970 [Deltaproteobacteria bacterium]|nr:hypothetical protein [Deltaproteobacteria bacterium]
MGFVAGALVWGCKPQKEEPSPPRLLLGQYSPKTSEHISKTCKGALGWSGADSVTCTVGDKPLQYYRLDFAPSGHVKMITFAGLDDRGVEEILDQSLAPLIDAAVMPALRASIEKRNVWPEPVPGIPFLSTSREDREVKGARRSLLMWFYSPPERRKE